MHHLGIPRAIDNGGNGSRARGAGEELGAPLPWPRRNKTPEQRGWAEKSKRMEREFQAEGERRPRVKGWGGGKGVEGEGKVRTSEVIH